MPPSRRPSLLLVVTLLGLALRLEPASPAPAVLQGRGWAATLREGTVTFETSGPTGPAQVELGAATIERGGASLGDAIGALRHRDDEVHVDHGAFVSHFTGTPEGLELSWAFPRAPDGRGDLVVSFSASAGVRAMHHGGVRWSAASLGPATWVDASGHRTAIEAQSVSGRLQYVVSTALLERSTFPAVLDPLLTPAVPEPIDPTGSLGPLDGDHRQVDLAFNGTNWLAVWLDQDPANGVVFTTLIDGADGGVGSAQRAAVGTSPGPVFAPAVAGGTGTSGSFLIVWQENGIKGALVSPAGVMGTPVPIAPSPAANPAVSWSGARGQYLVAWEGGGNLGAAWVQPMLTTFSVVPQTFQGVVPGTEPAVACGTSECLVAFTSLPGGATDIAGLRFSSPTVAPSAVPIRTAPDAQRNPTVSWTGSTWVVAWVDDAAPGNSTIDFATYEAMLQVFQPLVVAMSPGSKDQPSIACDATRCTLVYRAVSLAGVVQSVEFPLAPGLPTTRTLSMSPAAASGPAVALGASQLLIAWSSTLAGPTFIVGRLQAAGVPGLSYVVSRGPAAQEHVALASSPDAGVLAVWSDTRFDTGDVFARVLSLDGGALSQSFAVTSEGGAQSQPAAAWNGSEWLVVFGDQSRRLLARRVTQAGVVNPFATDVIDGDGGTGIAPGAPSIAAAGSQLYTTWLENGSVFGARLSRPSALLLVEPAGGLQLSATGQSCDRSAVASDGVSWLVAYSCTTGGLSMVEVAAVGTRTSLTGVSGPISSPAIAFGDGSYLVVWREGVAGAPSAINGAFVTGRSVGQPFTIATAQQGRALPSVAWSRWGFVVTWQEGPSTSRVTSAARLIDGGVQLLGAVFPGLRDATAAAVACPAPGRCLLAGSVDTAADGGSDAVRRELRNSPPVAVPSQVTVQGRTAFTFQATDDDGDPLSFRHTQPAIGIIEREPDGGWAYVPITPGPDISIFEADDGLDVSQSAVVNFVVGAGGGAAGGGAAGGGGAGGGAAGGGAAAGGAGGGAAAGGAAGGGAAGGGAAGGGAAGGGAAGGGAAGGGAAGGGAPGGGAAAGGGAAGGGAAGGDSLDAGPSGPPLKLTFVPACGCAASDGLLWLPLAFLLRRTRRRVSDLTSNAHLES